MRRILGIAKRLIITLGLLSLVTVLFPSQTQPLWDWAKSTGRSLGFDILPAFAAVEEVAGLALIGFILGGVIYSLWRDRRLEVLQAEYAFRTGATNMKEKMRDLEDEVQKLTIERNVLQEKFVELNHRLTGALVAAKEHEVRSQFGKEDREELRQLRQKFEEVLREKGNEGLRIALDLMMKDDPTDPEPADISLETPNDRASEAQRQARRRHAALPFARNY